MDCLVESEVTPAGRVLTVRRGDGGFRRLLIARDRRGVTAADGAEPARVTMAGRDLIDVRIGAERYRLPVAIAARP